MTVLTWLALVLSVVSLAVALLTLVGLHFYANQMSALLTGRTPEPRRVRRWMRATRDREITT